jgi:hypothetical protein
MKAGLFMSPPWIAGAWGRSEAVGSGTARVPVALAGLGPVSRAGLRCRRRRLWRVLLSRCAARQAAAARSSSWWRALTGSPSM